MELPEHGGHRSVFSAGGYIQDDIDTWLAHALAARRGHYRDQAVREVAVGLRTPPVRAHAALLTELLRLVPGVDVDQLAFAARLAVRTRTSPDRTRTPDGASPPPELNNRRRAPEEKLRGTAAA